MTNSNHNESGHPLLRYPVGESTPDMPGRPVQDPALAWEMAHAEDPIQEARIDAVAQGATDKEIAQLERDAIYQTNQTEKRYYESFGTTRAIVKIALANDDPMWIASESTPEAKQKRLDEQAVIIDDMRRFNAAFGHKTERTSSRYARWRLPDDRLLRPDQVGAYKELSLYVEKILGIEDFTNESYESESLHDWSFKSKTTNTYHAFKTSVERRRIVFPDDSPVAVKAYKLLDSVISEVHDLVEVIGDYIQQGDISVEMGKKIFSIFDLGRSAPSSLSEVMNDIVRDPASLEEILELNIHPDPAMIARKIEYTQEEGILERRQERQEHQQQLGLERAKALTQSQSYSEHVDLQEELRASLANNMPELAASIDAMDFSVGGEFKLDTLQDADNFVKLLGLKAAYTLSPEEYGVVYANHTFEDFNIWNMWQNDFKKPNKYYGGRPEHVAVSVHPVTDEQFSLAKKRVSAPLASSPMVFGVSISSASVRGPKLNEKVDFVSTMHLAVYLDRPRGRARSVLKYIALGSSLEGDMDRLALERKMDIAIGRSIYVAAVLRASTGTRRVGR